jgi:hypothetical protein
VPPPFDVDTPFVFVQHSVHINRSIAEARAELRVGPRRWFPRLDDPGHAEIGPGIGFRKKVTVEIGVPVRTGDLTEVSVTWQATFIKQLFPVMTGKVELAPVDPHTTRLTVCGMYQPPLGGLGKQLDDALLHRVAEATVKELAESIAMRMESAASDSVVEPV